MTDMEQNVRGGVLDLLDPKGAHGKGGLYLGLFWEGAAPKLKGCPALDAEHTTGRLEYVIDEAQRAGITLEDGNIFVRVEIKIRADCQSPQAADCFHFTKRKNKFHVPVLYLTIDGHEPSNLSKARVGKDSYVCISFKNEILTWLEASMRRPETEAVVPVRENLKQLIAGVKSLCGKSEDAETEDTIFKLATQSDDSAGRRLW
jgi:hypothetical protein